MKVYVSGYIPEVVRPLGGCTTGLTRLALASTPAVTLEGAGGGGGLAEILTEDSHGSGKCEGCVDAS